MMTTVLSVSGSSLRRRLKSLMEDLGDEWDLDIHPLVFPRKERLNAGYLVAMCWRSWLLRLLRRSIVADGDVWFGRFSNFPSLQKTEKTG